ncbi:MAG: hypothetical protein HYZ42_01260 [Bacteroidetes bacterium]|nr:hypothetical protein [Bacteroidota bacterium]
MFKQVLKTILAGVLGGLALFILPLVIVRIFLFFALMGMAFKLVGGRKRNHRFAYQYHQMNDEQRAEWMKKYGHRCNPMQDFNQSQTQTPSN